MPVNPDHISLKLGSLICAYVNVQRGVVKQIKRLASSMSSASPGRFLLLQFQMAQVTQVGDSISNIISQVNSMISNAVRNQKT